MSAPSPEPAPRAAYHPPSEPQGTAVLEDREESLLVRLEGEIDDELRPELDDLAREVAGRGRHPVRVDATAVTFMDSAGAAFLARLAVAVRPARLTVQASQPVGFLLELTRLSDVVDVVPADLH
jgi:anti-sigma B factor antagonist